MKRALSGVALATFAAGSFAASATPPTPPATKQPAVPTTAVMVVDTNGKVVGRLIERSFALANVNGQAVTLNLSLPTGTLNGYSYPINNGKLVWSLANTFAYATSDCTGQAYVGLTFGIGALATVTAKIGPTTYLWVVNDQHPTWTAINSQLSVNPDGTTQCYSSVYSFAMFPLSAPIDVKTLWIEPFSLQ